jgi:peptide/nickel transport system ATP-binding protein
VLLRIENLHTHVTDGDGRALSAVAGVSLSLERGQTLALVGESGCGKSLTAASIPRLLPPGARIAHGAIWFDGRDLVTLPEAALRRLRGDRIAMMFQEPMTCLNPVLSIRAQLTEVLRLHRRLAGRAARSRAVALLDQVGLREPERRAREFPHQLSGGMRQRVMIAMALACEPDLLIADEPTTALDVTIQAQILELLRDLQRRREMAMLFITHDLGVVAELADEVAVMYAGRIVEHAPTARLFSAPRHPYTRGLLDCTPRIESAEPDAAGEPPSGRNLARRLPVIPGEVPDLRHRPAGCAFHPRCELAGAEPRCQGDIPPLEPVHGAPGVHTCACWMANATPASAFPLG